MNITSNTGLIFTLSNAGLAIGALSFGLIVDLIGRRWAFNLVSGLCMYCHLKSC